jgi:hypothetical protein
MSNYLGEVPKGRAKAIWTSLELNLMLAFLYLASIACSIPVYEKDILNGA